MNKKIIYVILAIFSLSTLMFYLGTKTNLDNKIYYDKPNIKNNSNIVSMLYETESGSGIYEESNNTSWPSEGYTFNSTLSKCEQGSTLSWEAGKVKMMGNVSDKCYVYFDKITLGKVCENQNIAECFKDNYSAEKNLYYHKNLANSAEDGSYRYAGSYENVKNYICFGYDGTGVCPHDNLFRIIGIFSTPKQLKLIKADYAKITELGTGGDYGKSYEEYQETNNYGTNKGSNTKSEIGTYYWNRKTSTNDWRNSELNKTNLNTNFLNQFSSTWKSKISTVSWMVGGNTKENIEDKNAYNSYVNEVSSNQAQSIIYRAKIGLMYLNDLSFAALPIHWTKNLNYYYTTKNENWMYGGLDEWTITPWSENTNRAYRLYYDLSIGEPAVGLNNAVRPVFYLIPEVTLTGGSGTYSDPYKIA